MSSGSSKLGEVRVDIVGDATLLDAELAASKAAASEAGAGAGKAYTRGFSDAVRSRAMVIQAPIRALQLALRSVALPIGILVGALKIQDAILKAVHATVALKSALADAGAEYAKTARSAIRQAKTIEEGIESLTQARDERLTKITEEFTPKIEAHFNRSVTGLVEVARNGFLSLEDLYRMQSADREKAKTDFEASVKKLREEVAERDRVEFIREAHARGKAAADAMLSEEERALRDAAQMRRDADTASATARTDQERRTAEEILRISDAMFDRIYNARAKAQEEARAKEQEEERKAAERAEELARKEVEAARMAADAWRQTMSEAVRSVHDEQRAALDSILGQIAVSVERISSLVELVGARR